ncbi:PGF-pre-PGF domain-containing protein [Methanohalobium sp.]|uniref:PGF-pre-PGF domain-containing protein n=1 Tax=Methanohalobium sp. TaxID=2837493 RepID=UPI0025D5462E|nr:PGF-pre-PGF domain-containing protein [Methanohalobium sp.]
MSNIKLENTTVNGSNYVGALAGICEGKLISNHMSGNVNGDNVVGGIIGWNSNGTLKNSYATGDIKGDTFIGGLVGQNSANNIFYGSMESKISESRIIDSHATGDVSGRGIVGGLVGINSGIVNKSYATGDVDGNAYIGGLIGAHISNFDYQSQIYASKASGNVTGVRIVGGLIGSNGGPGKEYLGGLVKDSSASGAVTVPTGATGENIGGLVGQCIYGKVETSKSTGNVLADSAKNVGGLVGYNDGATYIGTNYEGMFPSIILESYSTGNIKGSQNVGGLIGMNYNYNVTDTYAIGSVEGTTNIGGLVGNNNGPKATVNHSYATGDVLSTGDTPYIGGILGTNQNDAKVTEAYWDVDTTGQLTSAGLPESNGLNTTEMKGDAARTNMEGFNTDVWWFVDNEYPKLLSDENPDIKLITAYPVSESVGVNENASYTLTLKNTGYLNDSYDLVVSSPRADAFLDKSSLNLAPGEYGSVNLNVSSDSGGNFDVKVSAVSTNAGQKETVTTTTKVEKYGLTMNADSSSSTIKPGNETNYTLTVKNTGNREDTYNLNVTAPSLSPGLTTGSLTIAPGNTQSFDVTLSNSTPGSYTATVNASSTSDTDEWTEKTLELNVEDKNNSGVSLSLNPTTKRVERNGGAAYTIKVKNTGNVEDTYSLINDSDASSSIGTSNMNLGPGESSSTTLTVSNTSEIKTYATDITVESDNFDVSSDGTVYTKAVNSVDISASPGSQTATQGNNSTYTISIQNTGIQTHNYTVSIPSKPSNTDSTLSRSTINDLEPGQTDEVTLSLNNTKSLAGGESRRIVAEITAYVTESPDKSDATTVSSLYSEEEVYGVSISSDVVEQAVKPDNNATYLLTVQNLGNSDETIDLSKSVQKGDLEKSSVSLSSSGDVGSEKVVKFNQSSSESGEVVITANSSGVTDSLTLNTRVAEVDQDNVVNSDVDDASTVTNSEVESSTIINSEVINDSVVNGSRVIDSSINNTEVIDSDLSNVMIKNGVVENNLIKKGVVTVDGTEYELTEEDEAVTAEELVSSEKFDSNIVGSSGETTQITSQNSNVTLNMTSDENYVGGSMKLQRSSTPPTDVEAENTNTSQYVRIKPTVNVEESTEYYVIKLSYTDEWLEQENIIEDTVSIYRNNENTGEWVKLVEEGDPSFCNGVERNLENNYVKANVTKFSTYEIDGQTISDQEDGDGVEEGSGTNDDSVRVSVGESMPDENVRSTDSKQMVVSAGESVEYDFSESSGPVKGISFDSKENIGHVVAKVETLDSLPENVKSPTESDDSDTAESGEKGQSRSKTYSTMSITVGSEGTVSDENSDNTLIEFDVTKEWVEDNNIDPETIRMERYHNGEWHELPTNKKAEDENLLHFTAFTQGFSIFTVVGDEIEKTGAEDEKTETATNDTTREPKPESEPEESTPGFTSILALGVLGAVYLVLKRR